MVEYQLTPPARNRQGTRTALGMMVLDTFWGKESMKYLRLHEHRRLRLSVAWGLEEAYSFPGDYATVTRDI